MTYDHYDEANKIIFELEKENYFEQARWLRESLENGSTGTEIFMTLRFHLDRIIKNNNIPKDLQNKCIILRRNINIQLENIR